MAPEPHLAPKGRQQGPRSLRVVDIRRRSAVRAPCRLSGAGNCSALQPRGLRPGLAAVAPPGLRLRRCPIPLPMHSLRPERATRRGPPGKNSGRYRRPLLGANRQPALINPDLDFLPEIEARLPQPLAGDSQRRHPVLILVLPADRQSAEDARRRRVGGMCGQRSAGVGRRARAVRRIGHAEAPGGAPAILSLGEFHRILVHAKATGRLIFQLLFGAGLRLEEAVRLRIRDLDLDAGRIHVRDKRARTTRFTILPDGLRAELLEHLENVRAIHSRDVREGYGRILIPYALWREKPSRARAWPWQYAFPASSRSRDPRKGAIRRHHVSARTVQRRLIGRSHPTVRPLG